MFTKIRRDIISYFPSEALDDNLDCMLIAFALIKLNLLLIKVRSDKEKDDNFVVMR